MGKFNSVPIEEDTIILVSLEASLGNFDVLYQKWFWDGITAESIIFETNDVAELTDTEIEQEVRSSPLVNKDSDVTLKRHATGFTFVNFNFETE